MQNLRKKSLERPSPEKKQKSMVERLSIISKSRSRSKSGVFQKSPGASGGTKRRGGQAVQNQFKQIEDDMSEMIEYKQSALE
jgi:hypothetical protein